MKLGVNFPTASVGSVSMLREYASTAENAGFDFISTIEHVSGAHADRFIGVDTGFPVPPYLYDVPFHEPFALFGFLAGMTSQIELVTSVLVLPQRETVLVAKQAAEVSMLSAGRLRLGIGVGWNHAEYESLGAEFHDRGHRMDEQIVVLRRLWSEPLVSFTGNWHNLDRVGIAPLPITPIPIWIGGGPGDATLRRVARFGAGWMPMLRAETDPIGLVSRMGRFLEEEGREPSSLEIQVNIDTAGDRAEWLREARQWETLGATHLMLMARGETTKLAPMRQLELAIALKGFFSDELGY